MFDILLVFMTFVVPGLYFSVLFFRVHEFKLCVVDMMVWGHVLIVLLPSIAFLFDESKTHAFQFYTAAAMGTLLLPLGALLGNSLVPVDARSVEHFRHAPLQYDHRTDRATLATMKILLGLCIFSVVSLTISTSEFPLKALFSGREVALVKQLRSEAGDATFFVTDIVMWTLAPILFVAAILYWSRDQSVYTKFFLFLCMLLPLLNNSFSGRKTPVALMFLLALFAVLIATRRPQRGMTVSTKRLTMLAVFGLLIVGYPVLIFMFLPAGANYTFLELLQVGIFERIFLRPAENTYAAFSLFPEQYPFTRFADIGRFSLLLGEEPIRVSRLIAFSFRGIEANSPPSSVGVFYFQHGWPGVVILSILVGGILKIAENLLVRAADKTILSVTLYAILVHAAIRISWGQYHAVFATEALVPVLVFFGILYTVNRSAVATSRRRRPAYV